MIIFFLIDGQSFFSQISLLHLSSGKNTLPGYRMPDWDSIPLLTKCIICLSVLVPVGVKFSIINYELVLFDWHYVIYKLQVWRLITPFFITGLNLNYLYSLFVRYKYCMQLQNEVFVGKSQNDFFIFLIFGVLISSVSGWILGLSHMWNLFTTMLVTVWCKYNSDKLVSFLFGIEMKAWILPFGMAVVDFLMQSRIEETLLGISIGYAWYHLKQLYPSAFSFNSKYSPVSNIYKDEEKTPYGYTIYRPKQANSQSTSILHSSKGRKISDN